MDLSAAFEDLTDKQRIYVEARLRGMSRNAAARAAGSTVNPKGSADQFEAVPAVQEALEMGRQISIEATGYTREKVTEMMVQAFHAATTAAEMVMAAREIGRLHGVYAPTQVKVDNTLTLKDARTEEDMRRLPTAELLKIAQQRGGDFIEAEYTDVSQPLRLTDEREKVPKV